MIIEKWSFISTVNFNISSIQIRSIQAHSLLNSWSFFKLYVAKSFRFSRIIIINDTNWFNISTFFEELSINKISFDYLYPNLSSVVFQLRFPTKTVFSVPFLYSCLGLSYLYASNGFPPLVFLGLSVLSGLSGLSAL